MGGPALAIGLAGCSSGSDSSGSTVTEQDEGTAATTRVTTPSEPECDYQAIDPDEPSGTIEIWHNRAEVGEELFDTAKARFETETDSELDVTAWGGATHYDLKMRALNSDGEGLHIFEWGHDMVTWFDTSVHLSDQRGQLDIGDCVLSQKALEIAAFDGIRFGMPWSAETVALFYNEDIVEEPPATLAEMTSIMDEYHEDGGETFGLGFPVNPYYVSGFAQAYGGEIYDGEADELGVDTDAVEKGLRVVTDDLKPYMPNDPESYAQQSVFENGNAPFLIGGPWNIDDLEEQDVEFGVTTLPDLPDGGTPRPYAGYEILYFGAKMDTDPNAGAARNFARWFATDEQSMLEHADRGNYVPINTELRASGRLPGTIQAFADQLETADPIPQREEMDWVWGPFGDAVEDAFNGDGELRANLESAAEAIREEWEEEEN
jgi:arabinogalactan oligomer/maltooligosaccharide transport system substrate-binding protein